MAGITNFFKPEKDPLYETCRLTHLSDWRDINRLAPRYFRRGLFTSSPLQFGQMFFISPEHFSQNVHS
jgi:hypothetical protein